MKKKDTEWQSLENQAGQLIQEASVTGGQNAEEWSGVALPLVRRIFGELAAQDFVVSSTNELTFRSYLLS